MSRITRLAIGALFAGIVLSLATIAQAEAPGPFHGMGVTSSMVGK
ncbi:hypothetical protein AB0L63_08635 [Nocardia sp. NPDC051990]